MKRILTSILAIASVSSILNAQVWEAKNADFNSSLRGASVYAINESVAWTWGYEQDSQGVETGLHGGISKTVDGGLTWHAVTFPFTDTVYVTSMWALDGEMAWITGYDYADGSNLIYKTINGGDTWEVFFDGINVYVDFIYMWNEQEGLIFGDPDILGFEIYTTQDGGVTWNRSLSVPFAPPEEYIYADNYSVRGNQIWVATKNGRIYYSPDKGISWEAWNAPTTNATASHLDVNDDGDVFLTYVKFDAITGMINGHLLFRTTDAGQSWENITAADNTILLNDIEAIPGSGVLMGIFVSLGPLDIIRTRISYDDGESWIEVDTQSLINYLDFYDVEVGYASENNYYFNPDPTVIYRYVGSPLTGLIKNTPLLNVDLSVFPIPATDVLNVSIKTNSVEDYWILVNDLSGRLIFKKDVEGVSEIHETMDMKAFPSGAYMVTIANSKGVITEKIVKK